MNLKSMISIGLFFLICFKLNAQSKFALIPKIGGLCEINTGSDKVFYLPFAGEMEVKIPFFHASAAGYYYRTVGNNFEAIPNVMSYDLSAALVLGKKETSFLLGGVYSLNNRSYGIDYESSNGNEYAFNTNSIYIQNAENGKEWTQSGETKEEDVRVHFSKPLPYYGAGFGFISVSPSGKEKDFITVMFYYYWCPSKVNESQTLIQSPYQINVPIEYSIKGLKYQYRGLGMEMKYNFYNFGLNLKMGTKPNVYVQDPSVDKLKAFERAFNMSFGMFLTF